MKNEARFQAIGHYVRAIAARAAGFERADTQPMPSARRPFADILSAITSSHAGACASDFRPMPPQTFDTIFDALLLPARTAAYRRRSTTGGHYHAIEGLSPAAIIAARFVKHKIFCARPSGRNSARYRRASLRVSRHSANILLHQMLVMAAMSTYLFHGAIWRGAIYDMPPTTLSHCHIRLPRYIILAGQ